MQRTIRKKKIIKKPIQEVWEAISNENSIAKWFMEGKFTAEDGAVFEFMDTPGIKWKGVFQGEILSAQEPINLAFSWVHSKLNHTTYVWWKLEDINGNTRIELEHSGFKGYSDVISSYSYGFFWDGRLKNLVKYLDTNPVISKRSEM